MEFTSAICFVEGALPTDVSPIIKAVTDPFSLLALIVLVLGLIATKWVPRNKDGKVWPSVVAMSILAISLLVIALNVMRYINTAKSGNAAGTDETARPLAITINITATQKTVKATVVPFEVGGGQVNFGCGTSAHPAVTYSVPNGARDITAEASWRNTDHAKAQSGSATIAGQMIVASGVITGEDRNWVGKCTGAGHGELVLKGTYTIDEEGDPVRVVNTVTGFITPGKEQTFAIAGVAGSSATRCQIVVSSVHGEIASATVPLNAAVGVEKPVFNGPIQASWAKGKLMVSVE